MAAELPVLPGIDVDAALARVNGKRALLWQLIDDFRQRQGDVVGRIDAAGRAGEFAAARELAHTVKGTAATLGMLRVAAAAGAIEHAALQERVDAGTVSELAAALAEIAAARLPEVAEPVIDSAAASRPTAALQRLATALASNSLSARQEYDRLRASLTPSLQVELTPIGQRIDALDFGEAAHQLARLAPRITAEQSSC